MCQNHILSHLLEKTKFYTALKRVTPPSPSSKPSPLFFLLCHSLLLCSLSTSPQTLYPLSCISSFLSNRLLSGHASDPSVIFLYAFYLNFISDFVIIYSLIYLGLFMHAVCETDSCIYQWNRVRS